MLLVVSCHQATVEQANDPAVEQTALDGAVACRMIQHDVGETEVCGKPQKIAVLGSHILDLLLSLGHQPAGYAAPVDLLGLDRYDQPAMQIPYLGDRITTQPVNIAAGSYREPNLERLTVLKPDLIIGEAGGGGEQAYNLLSQIAPTLLWEGRTAQGKWQQTIRTLALALGDKESADKAIATYEKLLTDAKQEFADVAAEHPQILLLVTNNLQDTIALIAQNTYLSKLLTEIGFELVTLPSDLPVNAPISVEALPDFDQADTIIILTYNLDIEDLSAATDEKATEIVEMHQAKAARQSWADNAIAQSLTASKAGRVHFATYYLWNGLNGPIGTELILEQMGDFLLSDSS
ncbi:ABC-type transporter, periplasmic subunit [Thalassoporum mexicanum PCC 7367]|nr:iron-siderophore ABC transporter substrate-binding protein [Pseudanabaena sp. PCC 7367]AFY71456.1 ABC-type transporter, periplasmic subunit [Pseudanabaena sp. PCC 7367]